MNTYSRSHLSDATLLGNLKTHVGGERTATAVVLADIAEVDKRKLYVPAGYSSMHAYCVEELHFTEDAAYKRIQVARAGRRFPAIFVALAEGRLHLSGACLLTPHLTPVNVDELLAAAIHRRKSEIESLVAERFPQAMPAPTVPVFRPLAPLQFRQLAPGQVAAIRNESGDQHAPAHVEAIALDIVSESAPGHAETVAPPLEPAPIPSKRVMFQLMIAERIQQKWQYVQALLSHAVPAADGEQVLERALDSLASELEKQKFGTSSKPRPRQCSSTGKRYVPKHVRRAVWKRDQGQCTFVGDTGHRCRATRYLEFDHIEPVARGGEATVEGIRLRCRAHNQYEAERIFGARFMQGKRDDARGAAEACRAAEESRVQAAAAEARAWADAADADDREEASAACARAIATIDALLEGDDALGARALATVNALVVRERPPRMHRPYEKYSRPIFQPTITPPMLPSVLTMNAVMIPQRSPSHHPTQPPTVMPAKMRNRFIGALPPSPRRSPRRSPE